MYAFKPKINKKSEKIVMEKSFARFKSPKSQDRNSISKKMDKLDKSGVDGSPG